MIKTFVSYRRKPSSMLANLIRERLVSSDIQVFVDTQDMDDAGSFPDQLRNEIANSDVFICLLAKSTLDSELVREEIQHAFSLKKLMIPVFQESYVAARDTQPDYIKALLMGNGVTFLDQRNEYVNNALDKLEHMILSRKIGTQQEIASANPFSKSNTISNRTKVEIRLDLSNKSDLDTDKFIKLIAGLTSVGINEITLVNLGVGSVIVELLMPSEAANLLKENFLAEKNFTEFRPLEIKIIPSKWPTGEFFNEEELRAYYAENEAKIRLRKSNTRMVLRISIISVISSLSAAVLSQLVAQLSTSIISLILVVFSVVFALIAFMLAMLNQKL